VFKAEKGIIMANLDYTVGNWTVASHEVDTILQPKTVQIPDLDFAHDYSVMSNGATETRLLNASGTSLEPTEKLRYAREHVKDIYRSTDIDGAYRLPSPAGVRVLMEVQTILSVTNSVTGQELLVPVRSWKCLETSVHPAITGQALLWQNCRQDALSYGTNQTNPDMLVKLFRGDLDPTR
jgi:hypothetical protein